MGCLTLHLIPLREPTSASSGHLLPEEGGRSPRSFPPWRRRRNENTAAPKGRIGHWRYEREWGNTSQAGGKMRVAPFPYRHFERSREIFLAHWSDKRCGRAVNTVLHTTWNDGLPHMYCFPACKKDPSAALGMTKREAGCLTWLIIRPRRRLPLRGSLSCAFGAPLLQGATQRSCKNAMPEGTILVPSPQSPVTSHSMKGAAYAHLIHTRRRYGPCPWFP